MAIDRLTDAERLAQMLRQRLIDRARTAKRDSVQVRTVSQSAGGVKPVSLSGLDEKSQRRKIVERLLAENLGPQLVNDAQFQQITTQVTQAIESDPDMASLFAQLLKRDAFR
jgi:hypothetical protein